MKTHTYKILLSIFILNLISSCANDGYDEYDAGGSPTEKMNGEWFVDVIDSDGNVLVAHALHKTYDTTDGDGKMYIDDMKNGWYLGGLVNANTDDLTFNVTDEDNFQDPGTTFNITEGKILKDAAHSPTGAVVDSIYFKGEFSYDPGNILTFSGYKRTGFLEEE